MKVLIKNTIYFLVLLYSHGLFAEEVKQTVSSCETAIDCSVSQGNTANAGTTTSTTEGGSSLRRQSSGNTTTTNFGTAGETGTGAYSQAKAAKNKANGTMIAAFGLSAVLATMCNPPANIVPCILSPIAAVAGMLAGRKKKEAQQVMNSLGNDGTAVGNDGNTSSTTDTASTAEGAGDMSTASFAKIKADLGKKGVIMNDDGSIVLPNGKTIAADLNTQSLQNAGLDNSQIAQLGTGVEKLKKDMNDASGNTGAVEEVNLAGAGTGIGNYDGGRTKLDGSSRDVSSSSVEADRTVLNRDPAAWTGFSTKYGDSQIGVQQSDIFLMVEKRVENERKVMGQ